MPEAGSGWLNTVTPYWPTLARPRTLTCAVDAVQGADGDAARRRSRRYPCAPSSADSSKFSDVVERITAVHSRTRVAWRAEGDVGCRGDRPAHPTRRSGRDLERAVGRVRSGLRLPRAVRTELRAGRRPVIEACRRDRVALPVMPVAAAIAMTTIASTAALANATKRQAEPGAFECVHVLDPRL